MNAYYYADIILKRSINKLFTNIIIDKKQVNITVVSVILAYFCLKTIK